MDKETTHEKIDILYNSGKVI